MTTSGRPPLPSAPELADAPGLLLRRHRAQDLADIVGQCQDREMAQWTTIPVPYGRADAERFLVQVAQGWQDGSLAAFAIIADGRFAGTIDLRLDGAGGAEVGFGLAPWARGRRVMSRALRLVLHWGFEELALQVVHWRAYLGNWASRRTAWACGFTEPATVRDLLVQRGERRDGWVGSLRRGEAMAPVGRWLVPPVLFGELVRLRPWRPSDADAVAEACSDLLTQRWLPALPAPYTKADAEEYLSSREPEMAVGQALYWCVADPATDSCRGAMSLLLGGRGPAAGELGWWAHPGARGRGLLTDAARLAAAHAFAPFAGGGLGLHRLLVRVAEGNRPSQGVALRLGARPAGRDREAERYRDGHREDVLRYDLLAPELPA